MSKRKNEWEVRTSVIKYKLGLSQKVFISFIFGIQGRISAYESNLDRVRESLEAGFRGEREVEGGEIGDRWGQGERCRFIGSSASLFLMST